VKIKTGEHMVCMVECPEDKTHQGVDLVKKKVRLRVIEKIQGVRYFTSIVPGDSYSHYLVCRVCGTRLKKAQKICKSSEEVDTGFGGKKKRGKA